MLNICIGLVYADVRHMDMLHIYGLPSFSRGIRKKAVPDLHMQLRPPATTKHPIQYHSLLRTTVCGGYAFPQPAGAGGRKQRFAYSLTVVHFRKIAIRQKVGSTENREQVI